MKMGICYCKPDVMSQCVAEDFGDQYACDYFENSSKIGSCLFLNKNLSNHCWNPEAQTFGREYGVVRVEDLEMEEEELSLVDEIIFNEDNPRRNCHNCTLHPCHEYVKMAQDALDRGGITTQDFWDIGSSCAAYTDEEMVNDAIAKALTP